MSAAKSSGKKQVSESEASKTGKLKRVAIEDDFDLDLTSFAWLELISHRSFMPKLLTVNPLKGWPLFQRLLLDLLNFMEPHLWKAKMGKIHYLYKGTMRVLVLLLHEFPEFLCDYHLSFCGVIPSSSIQMRNIILSAFSHNMKVPDPFTPNLKVLGLLKAPT